MHKVDYTKYLIALIITGAIFTTAILLSNYFNNKRLIDIRSVQDKISIDILSSETQFDLLKEIPCTDLDNSVLSQELNSLAEKLTYMEKERAQGDSELLFLKRYYSLLEIKDYLLSKKVGEQCHLRPVVIFYFYSNAGDCPLCEKEGYVLTYLRAEYPQLRIYSFDSRTDLSAVKTLASIYNLKNDLPALIIGGHAIYGFKSIDDMEKLIPEIAQFKKDNLLQQSATSTKATTTTTVIK
jgi:hypothetical protein